VTYTINVARVSDAIELVDNLRPIDELEVSYVWGKDFYASARYSIKASALAWSVRDSEGKLLMIFGVAPVSGEVSVGAPWMLATVHFEGYSKALLRESRHYVNLMNSAYPFLINMALEKNHKTIRWLKWCGFEFPDKKIPMRDGAVFVPFQRYMKVNKNV
jgi:hypothetical protein